MNISHSTLRVNLFKWYSPKCHLFEHKNRSIMLAFTWWGNAYRRAIAAKSISTQIKKFWYPADTVPADVVAPSLSTMGEITPPFSKIARPTPKKCKHNLCYFINEENGCGDVDSYPARKTRRWPIWQCRTWALARMASANLLWRSKIGTIRTVPATRKCCRASWCRCIRRWRCIYEQLK